MKQLLSGLLLLTLIMIGQPAIAEAVDVNRASAEELAAALTGVGASRARAIVEYRERFGDFTSLEDLLGVQGIGPAVLDANREHIVFGD